MDAQIEELSLVSLDDESVLSFPVPDRIYGFHAQQAVEKLLKMLILGLGNVMNLPTTYVRSLPPPRVWARRCPPFHFP
jgi:hypothetical protein